MKPFLLAFISVILFSACENLSLRREKAEEASEDAVINSIKAGLGAYSLERLVEYGNKSWPTNPWDALETKPAGYDASDTDNADSAGEWTYNTSTFNITHMRGNGDVKHWDYTKGTNDGRTVGTLGAREDGAGN